MSPRSFFSLPALACALLALASALHASVLVLSNGDRLTGQVVKREGGKVYFHSDILGDIVAPENAVTIVEKHTDAQTNAMVGLPPQKQTASAAVAPEDVPAETPETPVLSSPTASTLPSPTVAQAPAVVVQAPPPRRLRRRRPSSSLPRERPPRFPWRRPQPQSQSLPSS